MPKKLDLTNQKYGRLLIISPAPNDGKYTQWNCICDCGNKVIVKTINLRTGHTKSCGCLKKENEKQLQKNMVKKVMQRKEKEVIGKKYGRWTVLKRGEQLGFWVCKCDCGTIRDVYGNNLFAGKSLSCGCLNKEKIRQIHSIDITNQKFNKLTALYPTGKSVRDGVLWHCKCECGNEIDVTLHKLTRGNTGSCGCLKSKNNSKIAQLLSTMNLEYDQEYIFKNSLSYKRFDFYVNNQYIIEYDGEQHFKQKGAWDFKGTRENDLIKNKYCFDNNIPLIRIPYYADYTKNDLKLETTRFLLTPENEEQYYENNFR